MKKLLLILISLFSLQNYAQDPDLFQTWYLRQMEFEFGDGIFIPDIEPSIFPSLTISENLDFEGIGACNSFSGNFIYDEIQGTLTSVNFNKTLIDCVFPEHIQFEILYFEYFEFEIPLQDLVYYEPVNKLLHLHLESNAGFILDFINVQLSISEHKKLDFKIYPNPAKDVLIIDNNSNTEIISIKLYDVLGGLVFNQEGDISEIDASHLNSGVLFIEIETEEGVLTKKIIKE